MTKACQALPPMTGGMLAGDVTSCKPWSMTKACQALPPMAGGMLAEDVTVPLGVVTKADGDCYQPPFGQLDLVQCQPNSMRESEMHKTLGTEA
eukprot:1159145-Pelagomonas_calceolata.AAC.4